MASDNSVPIPNKFEGKSTKYELFDGFSDSSFPMKILYIASIPTVMLPAAIELFAAHAAKTNYKKAEAFFTAHPEQNPANKSNASTPDLNPGALQDGRHAAEQEARNQVRQVSGHVK